MSEHSTSKAPSPTVDIPARVRSAVAAADGRKAIDLRVLHLGAVTSFTDYFVLATGNSERQVEAIADAVDARLRSEDVRPLSAEGYGRGHWVLLDYGDFLVHVFTGDRREFYGLEKLWADAPDVTDDFLPDRTADPALTPPRGA